MSILAPRAARPERAVQTTGRLLARLAGVAAVCLACGACRARPSGQVAAEAAVTIEHAPYEGFADAWRLSNGAVELVAAPQAGRIVRYGLIGGSNVLWSSRSPDGSVWRMGAWTNWGGDKVWIWPQDGWPRRTGRVWPPPGDGLRQRWEARAAGKLLIMTGPAFEGHGCRAVREISLAPTGTAVTIVTRLEALDAADIKGLSAWCITQVPAAPWVEARLAADASGNGVHDPLPGWPAPQRSGRRLLFQRPGNRGCKSFVDADRWAVPIGGVLFVQEASSGAGTSAYRPGERAQLYTAPDDEPYRPAGIGPATELEFTSPPAAAGQTPEITVVWTLTPHHGPADARAREGTGPDLGP